MMSCHPYIYSMSLDTFVFRQAGPNSAGMNQTCQGVQHHVYTAATPSVTYNYDNKYEIKVSRTK